MLEVAKENARNAAVSDRYSTIEGSAFDVEYGSGYDLVLLTNFLHHFDTATCETLLRKVRAALADGGRAFTMERLGRPFYGVQAGSASAEEARLLQGHESTRGLSDPIVRLSRLYVSAETGGLARQSIPCFIPARSQPESAEGNPADDPTVGVPSSERQIPGRPGPDVQSVHPRLDQLLQSLLQVGTDRTLSLIDAFLIRWARIKFKRLRQRPRGARDWVARVIRANPILFAHWRFRHVYSRTSGAV